MKSFLETIHNESTNAKLDILGQGSISPDILQKLQRDYSEFKHINLEDWEGYPFPKNSSDKTLKEIQYNISLGQFRTQYEDAMTEYDTNTIKPFKDYIDEYGLEVDFDKIKQLKKQSVPIVLALKRHYNRPRPKVLSKVLGLSLETFPLPTGLTSIELLF